jgi:hypothetical protein
MCDYSLMSVPNRLAVAGEELVTHRFQSGSIGLASPQPRPKGFWENLKRSLNPPLTSAVCIPPGASLIMHDIKAPMQREIGVGPVEEVTFTQLSAADNNYRDAVRFRNGREVRLQELCDGMRVQVVDLCGGESYDPVWDERPELTPVRTRG